MTMLLKRSLLLIIFLSVFSAGALSAAELTPGQVIGRNIFGLATDANHDPLLINEDPLIYDAVSFQQTMRVGSNTFVVSGFNHLLGSLYLTRYTADTKTALDTFALDLPSVEGLSHPTGAILSPWQTLMFSESQVSDAAQAAGFVDAKIGRAHV